MGSNPFLMEHQEYLTWLANLAKALGEFILNILLYSPLPTSW